MIVISEGLLKVFPNPTSDVLHIEVDKQIDMNTDIWYAVRSADGRKVRAGQWYPGMQISMRSLVAGIYNIELVGDGILRVVRVVVIGQ